MWQLVSFMAYLCGIEILARIAKTSPFVPYEFAKYAFLALGIVGLIKFAQTRLTPGIVIVLLTIPGLFLISVEGFREKLVNSFLGIFLLGLISHLYHDKRLSNKQLESVFRNFLYGIIAIATAVTVRTPSFSELQFELGANFATSGGFGSNQVSTILGAGFMVISLAFLLRMTLFPIKVGDIAIALFFIFRALLTFSRGGVLGGLLSVALAYIVPGSNSGMRKIKTSYLVLIGLGFYGVFALVNFITQNTITQRYRGETYTTQIGQKEVSATTITSGRTDLMTAEFKMFIEDPILGTGPGGGEEGRYKYYGARTASHTEITRLLAEHGIPGVLMVLIFLFFPVFRVLHLKTKRERMLATAFFTLAIFSSFHASMRTTITPFFWALGCMRFPDEQSELAEKS